MTSEAWRLLPYHRGSSELHFALSDSLVRILAEASLWWHSANAPALILGAGQTGTTLSDSALRRRVSLVRRQAGGTAVLATPSVLGLDIVLPAEHPLAIPDIVEAYHWLGEVWVEALARLDIRSHALTIAEARAWEKPAADIAEALATACFGGVSPYEVIAGGRKLVGLAQVRRSRGVLWQSGLHLDFDARALAEMLAPDSPDHVAAGLRRCAVGLQELSSVPRKPNDIFGAFAAALTDRLGVVLAPGRWSAEELQYADAGTEMTI